VTTAAQVRKLVQPLLDSNPDLAWIGRQIYLRPARHFARTILIDRLLDPVGFRPQWAVAHLFECRTTFPLAWGEWLSKKSEKMPGSWRIYDPHVSAQLTETIESDALPILRAMRTLEDYLTYVAGSSSRHQLYEWATAKIVLDVALGDLEAARLLCAQNLASWSRERPHHSESKKTELRKLCELCALLQCDNRAGLARLLHEWEAQSVKNLKIERIWEPTPFPLELQTAK
jgi:hypothetical protein